MQRDLSWYKRLFSVRSPIYLPAFLVFWWEASNWPQRLTLPLRLPLCQRLPQPMLTIWLSVTAR
jgi:hypothetical protein